MQSSYLQKYQKFLRDSSKTVHFWHKRMLPKKYLLYKIHFLSLYLYYHFHQRFFARRICIWSTSSTGSMISCTRSPTSIIQSESGLGMICASFQEPQHIIKNARIWLKLNIFQSVRNQNKYATLSLDASFHHSPINHMIPQRKATTPAAKPRTGRSYLMR